MVKLLIFFSRLIFLSLALTPIASMADKGGVLFSIQPIALMHKALMPENTVQSEVLLDATKNSHDYQLTVEDIRQLSSSEHFYWLGEEANISKISKRLTTAHWILLKPNHEHAWLGLSSLDDLLTQLSASLQQQYPEQAPRIKSNEQQFKQQLVSFFQQQKLRFKTLHHRGLLLGHSAFLPFAKALGLSHIEIYRSGHSHGHKSGGMADLMYLQQQIQQQKLVCSVEEPDVKFTQLQQRFPMLKIVSLDPLAQSSASLLTFFKHAADTLYLCLKEGEA